MFKCDSCGKDTMLHPPTKPVYKEVRTTQMVPVQKGGLPDQNGNITPLIGLEEREVVTQIPETIKVKRQNPLTGQMEDMEVPALEDLFERAYIVRLTVGQEEVQRDFCKPCLQAHMAKVRSLFDALSAVSPRE
jgi:hypothetical protein